MNYLTPFYIAGGPNTSKWVLFSNLEEMKSGFPLNAKVVA